MYIKRSIIKSLHNIKKKDSTYSIVRIRVSCQGSRIDLNTGISVPPNKWNDKKECVKQGCTINGVNYNEVNNTLLQFEGFIHKYFTDCEQMDRSVSLSELRDSFNAKFKSTGKKNNEFFYFFEEYIKEQASVKGWKKDMIDVYSRLCKQLKAYNPDLRLVDLNTSTMEEIKVELSERMYNGALKKRLSYLKAFLKWAKSKKHSVNEEAFIYNPKLPTAKKAVRYLEAEDLDTIYYLDLKPGSALDQTRDFFLFQCYTALRYSDLKQLTTDKIVRKSDGYYIQYLLTQKDMGNLEYKLTDRATEIFLKYQSRKYPANKVFPVLSNQKYKEHLKELGELARLEGEWIDHEFRLQERIEVRIPKKDLSSHTARRAFVVTALNIGVPVQFIMKITDHSDMKTMKPYIEITQKGASQCIDAIT